MDHIEIDRQDITPKYRGRPNPMAPHPPNRNRSSHGKKLKDELSKTSDRILNYRRDNGIQSDNLIVLEMQSQALTSNLLEIMLRNFNMYLVEETLLPEVDNSKLVVQFIDKAAIEIFNTERDLWERDVKEDAILTYAKRRDLFACISCIRCVSREDRMGPRLIPFLAESEEKCGEYFTVNIDIWYNNDRTKIIEIERQIKSALGTEGSKLLGDLFEIPGLLLGRARVNEFSLNAILDLDIVCSIDLPFSTVSEEPFELYNANFKPIVNNTLNSDAPLATILDSGVFTGNPLLHDVIVAEEEFDTCENTTSDLNGHGTGVAGIVVYGDLSSSIKSKIFTPLVRICNGKIMHNETIFGQNCPSFPNDVRPEKIVKDAITYFFKEFGCRIFNLSAGNADNIYNGGRQFAWAEMLDQLSRDLDIVIIVSAGNVSEPVLNDFSSRDELIRNARDQLFTAEHRLIDPSTSALSITVGSVTRFVEPSIPIGVGSTRISAGLKDSPSVFTRIGKGINKAIKPEFVDYGGNYAVRQRTRGDSVWVKNDPKIVEPTLNHTQSKIFKGYCGTSFSAPHVTHVAARIEKSLEHQLGEKPSANLIRAMIANSATCTDEMIKWAEESTDVLYKGNSNPKQERRLRLIGYGKTSTGLLSSTDNNVTMFTEDSLELRNFHLYKIPVPKRFLKIKARKSITISLAYNPIVRLSRKEYLANNLWFEVFRRIDEETLINYKEKKEKGIDTVDDFNKIPNSFKAEFSPGYNVIMKSTLQQRKWSKGKQGGLDLLWEGNDNPYIYILVSGKERFKYAEQEQPQDYALCVTFSYDSKENIGLYNELRNGVKLKDRQQAKTQPRIRV